MAHQSLDSENLLVRLEMARPQADSGAADELMAPSMQLTPQAVQALPGDG